MKFKSIWFLVCYVVFLPTSMVGELKQNVDLERANAWLEKSSVGMLFFAQQMTESEGLSSLILKNGNDFSNPTRMWQSWQYLKAQYQENGMSLIDEIFNGMSRVTREDPEVFEVRLICGDSSVFDLRIFFENGKVAIKEDVSFERDLGTTPYEVLRTLSFSDLEQCITLTKKRDEVLSVLLPLLKRHYSAQNKVKKYYKFDQMKEQDGSLTVKVKGLRAMVTSKFHEQVELRISCVEVREDVTILCYRLSGAYSSGILQPGKFTDFKNEYIPELVNYNEQLKNLIGKSIE